MGFVRSIAITALLALASCGTVTSDFDAGMSVDAVAGQIDAAPGTIDAGSQIDAMPGAADAGTPDAAVCPTFGGTWYTTQISFAAAVGTTQFVDFETVGDLITTPTAGTEVPKDEYLACCDIQVEYDGTDPNGRLIWAGNATGGFALRTDCPGSPGGGCLGAGPNTIRVTFVGGASAAGGMQSSPNYFAWMYDAAGEISSNTGTEWMGYASATTITSAKFGRSSSGNLESVRYQRCP